MRSSMLHRSSLLKSKQALPATTTGRRAASSSGVVAKDAKRVLITGGNTGELWVCLHMLACAFVWMCSLCAHKL